jgi:hypothetical protein
MKWLAGVLLGLLVLTGCRSLGDVKPGDGRKAMVGGRTYEQVWHAALKVAGEYFEIRERDPARGMVLAERTPSAWSAGAYVGIYISPPVAGAATYTVEVVGRKKFVTQLGEQDWEYRVLRDMLAELALPAPRR